MPRAGAPRGEIVIVVGATEARPAVSEAALDREIAEQLTNLSVKDAAAAIAAKAWAAETADLCARAGDCRRPAVKGRADQRTERRRDAHLYGLKAESIAALLLRLKGYTILARRFVVSGGEIDLVARRGGSIAFVEVKARADLEVAAIAISATKRRRIARAARVWLTRNPWAAGLTLRGDAVFVGGDDRFVIVEQAIDGSGKTGRSQAKSYLAPSVACLERAVEVGFPRVALRRLVERLAGDDKSKISGLEWDVVPKTTLERRKNKLSTEESEQTARIARLFVHSRRKAPSPLSQVPAYIRRSRRQTRVHCRRQAQRKPRHV